MKKRILSVVLVVCMLLTLVPTAFAAAPEGVLNVESFKVGETEGVVPTDYDTNDGTTVEKAIELTAEIPALTEEAGGKVAIALTMGADATSATVAAIVAEDTEDTTVGWDGAVNGEVDGTTNTIVNIADVTLPTEGQFVWIKVTNEGTDIYYKLTITEEAAETTYTVKFDLNKPADAAEEPANKPADQANLAVGAKVTKPETDPTCEGYTFKGWAATAEATADNVIDFDTYTVAAPDTGTDITLYAVWAKDDGSVDPTTVTFNVGNTGIVVIDVTNATKVDGVYTVTAPETDVTFKLDTSKATIDTDTQVVKVAIGASELEAADGIYTIKASELAKSVTVAVTIEDKAEEPAKTVTVTFDTNGGSAAPTIDTPIAVGGKVELSKITAPTKDGYTFEGWKLDGALDSTASKEDYIVTEADVTKGSIKFVAVWAELQKYDITFDANGGKFGAETTKKLEQKLQGYVITAEDIETIGTPTNDDATKIFLGWAATKNATDAETIVGAEVTAAKTYYAVWATKQTEGIQAGFAWHGNTANADINAAIKTAGKSKTISDCLDQAVWMLINEPITSDKHYWYEIKLNDVTIQSDKFEGTDTATGIIYFSFLHKEQNAVDSLVKEGDIITFNLWSDSATINEKPNTEVAATKTVTVTANDMAIGEVTPDIAAKTVNVKFNSDLYGRYYITLTKGNTVVAKVTTECDRSQPNAGIAQATGYTFEGLTLTEGTYDVNLYQSKADEEGAAGDAIATKEAAFDVYKVEFKNDAEAVGEAAYAIAGGKVTAPAAPVVADKTFTGWKVGETTVAAGEEYTVVAADATDNVITLTAEFAKSITVKFDLNYTDAADPTEQIAGVGAKLTKPADPTRAGYVFKGWAEAADATAADVIDFATYTVKDPGADATTVTLYAVWESDSIVSAKLLDENDEVVASATVEITADNKLVITGAIPAAADVGTTYKIEYTLASETATSPVTVTLKTTGGVVVIDPAATIKVSDELTYTVSVDTDLVVLTVEAGSPAVTEVQKEGAFADLTDDDITKLNTALATVTTTNMDALVGAAAKDSALIDTMKAAADEKNIDDYSVEVYLDIKPTNYVPEDGAKTLVLEITPMARLVDTSGAPTVVQGTETKVENFQAAEGEEVTISVPLPVGFIANDTEAANIYVKHGTEYIQPESATAASITFKTSSFSPFEIVVDSRTVTVTFNDAEGAEIITATYNLANVGKAITLPTVEVPDGKVLKGWGKTADGEVIIAANVTTMTDELLTALTADGATLTLVPVFGTRPVTPPVGPGVTTYTVTVDAATNGKVDVSPKGSIAAGTKVTVTVTPNDGYVLDTLTVKNGAADVAVTENADGTYSFTMPAGNVTVTATFKVASIDLPFTDLNPDAWYMEAIKYVCDNGFFNGTSETTFAPNNNMTRAMFVTVLHRMAGLPEVTGENKFTDVADDYYTDAVIWASENGIVEGYDDGTFKPSKHVTRAEMVTFIYRYAKLCELDMTVSDDLTRFTDAANVPDWALEATQWAVGAEIINGVDDTTLAMGNTSTRAQVAKIVLNISEFSAK